jgi:adenine-specific DNA methylase
VGSKQKLASWIWGHLRQLKFDTMLDAFSGTGTMGFIAKLHGKEVTCNDILKSSYLTACALVENGTARLTEQDVSFLISRHKDVEYPDFIQRTFKGIYYTDEENTWLDTVVTNIRRLSNDHKRALAYHALFQACLVKRPFNLFHRKNLYVRLAEVKRSFGNKKTWDTPFPVHFRNFVREANARVFDNGRRNHALNMDAFEIPGPERYDLVYIDTPYFSEHSASGVDYLGHYHFLNGLAEYERWPEKIDYNSKHLRFQKVDSVWADRDRITSAFDILFKRFSHSKLIVSYRSHGIPSKEQMVELLQRYKSQVVVKEMPFKYVLSKPLETGRSRELLFIAT